MRRALVGMAMVFGSGCITDAAVDCADGTRCPSGFQCADLGAGAFGCRRDDVSAACDLLDEGAPCTVGGAFSGSCHIGACTEISCGNGITQPGEACDDGNHTDGDGCDFQCASDETCGNGYRDPGEACDDGDANADAPDALCRLDCQLPSCGDGITDPSRGETCDDGNLVPGDGCTFACIVESCGNGVVDYFAGEQCDDGDLNSRAPDANCRPTCLAPSCGDGVIDPGLTEQCDRGVAGNRDLPDGLCRSDCQLPRCGDGITDPSRAEACDDGNNASGDGCRGDCLSDETCGNGIVDPFSGEVCDDNNAWRHDGCSGCLPETLSWTDATASTGPTGAYCGAFDPGRDVFVIFGGEGDSNATWELSGATWRRRTPAVRPPGRTACAMAYDAGRGRTVLFGGNGQTGYLRSDTWEWDGEAWISRGTSGPSRYLHSLVYVGSRGKVLSYGNQSDAGVHEWTGTTWQYVGQGPPARERPGLTYDPVRDVVVVHGGSKSGSVFFNDTWEWNGTTWTDVSPAVRPPAVNRPTLWYSPSTGATHLDVSDDNLWTWQGGTWTATPTATPLPAIGLGWNTSGVTHDRTVVRLAAVYDLVLGTPEIWFPRATTSAPVRASAAGTWNSGAGHYALFGGYAAWTPSADLYIRRRGGWTRVVPGGGQPWPAARVGHAMAYDPMRDRTVLMGGLVGGAPQLDLWEWDGAAWTEISSGGTWPGLTTDSAMVFDPVLGETLLIGGSDGTTVRREVWSWNGTRWLAQALLPVAISSPGVAWDPKRRVVVLAGGNAPSAPGGRLQTTYEWSAGTWAYRGNFGTIVPMRKFTSMVYDPMRGRVVTHGGEGYQDRRLGDTWEWTGSTWAEVSLDGPITQSHVAFYDPEAAEHVVVVAEGSVATAGEWRMRFDSTLAEDGCVETLDGDGDGATACDDPDCWWACTPSCPPETSCITTLPSCGDGVCSPVEGCGRCVADCGVCASVCGDNLCAADEDIVGCPGDCTLG